MDELLIMSKMLERKLFLQIQSINIMYPKVQNVIGMPLTKRMKIMLSIQVYLISQMNFDYKENDRKKAFLPNLKQQYRVSQCGEHDCHDNNKKNGDCYKYPCLSHFMDEL